MSCEQKKKILFNIIIVIKRKFIKFRNYDEINININNINNNNNNNINNYNNNNNDNNKLHCNKFFDITCHY